MNNTFNLQRYIYFERTKLRQTAFQLIGIIVLFELLFFLLVLLHSIESTRFFFPLGFIHASSITIMLIAPIIFEPKLTKNNIIYLFTLPISKTERFVSYILKYVITLPLLLVLLYYISAILEPYLLPRSIYNRYFINLISETFEILPIIYAAQSIGMIIYLTIRKYTLVVHITIILTSAYFITLIGLFSTYICNDHSISYSFITLLNPILYMKKWTGDITTITLYSGIVLNYIMTIGLWHVIYLKIKEFEI